MDLWYQTQKFMIKKIIRGIVKKIGYDFTPINEYGEYYNMLYDKYSKYSMIHKSQFILNLELCNYYKHIKGDYVECGVWKGGMSAAISEIIGNSKQIHLFDSFEGLPIAKEIDGKEALEYQMNTNAPNYFNNCSVDESFVIEAMKLSGIKNPIIYKGWFDKSLKNYPKNSISILRLDGDWFESIKVCLDYLFPYVTEGGIIIIDDYYSWDGCSKAVHSYLAENNNPSRIYQWRGEVPYIIKKNQTI